MNNSTQVEEGGIPESRATALVAGLAATSGFAGIVSMALLLAVLYIRRLRRQIYHLRHLTPGAGGPEAGYRQKMPSPRQQPLTRHSFPTGDLPRFAPSKPQPSATAWPPHIITSGAHSPPPPPPPPRSSSPRNQNFHYPRQQKQASSPFTPPAQPQPSADDFFAQAAAAVAFVERPGSEQSNASSDYYCGGKEPKAEVQEMLADENAPWRAIELEDGERFEPVNDSGCVKYLASTKPRYGVDYKPPL